MTVSHISNSPAGRTGSCPFRHTHSFEILVFLLDQLFLAVSVFLQYLAIPVFPLASLFTVFPQSLANPSFPVGHTLLNPLFPGSPIFPQLILDQKFPTSLAILTFPLDTFLSHTSIPNTSHIILVYESLHSH